MGRTANARSLANESAPGHTRAHARGTSPERAAARDEAGSGGKGVGGGRGEEAASLQWMKTVSFRNTKYISFGRKSLRSAHAQAMEDVYGWGGLSEYPDSSLAMAIRRCMEMLTLFSKRTLTSGILKPGEMSEAAIEGRADGDDGDASETGEVLSTARISMNLELGGIINLHGSSDEAADIVFKLMVGMLVTQLDDLDSFYAPPYLKYTYCPEEPILFEGSLIKNLLIGATTQQVRRKAGQDER